MSYDNLIKHSKLPEKPENCELSSISFITEGDKLLNLLKESYIKFEDQNTDLNFLFPWLNSNQTIANNNQNSSNPNDPNTFSFHDADEANLIENTLNSNNNFNNFNNFNSLRAPNVVYVPVPIPVQLTNKVNNNNYTFDASERTRDQPTFNTKSTNYNIRVKEGKHGNFNQSPQKETYLKKVFKNFTIRTF